jgi:hypothetical protein
VRGGHSQEAEGPHRGLRAGRGGRNPEALIFVLHYHINFFDFDSRFCDLQWLCYKFDKRVSSASKLILKCFVDKFDRRYHFTQTSFYIKKLLSS